MASAVAPRLPESRRVVTRNPELVFQRVNEILVQSSSVNRDPCSKLIQLNSSLSPAHVPLKTRKIDQWPTRTDACCLHCSEPCPATPLPAVQFFDPEASSYWLCGYFCRPCCSLAYIQSDSQFNSDRTRCNMWTREVLTKFFKIHSTTAAPPRAALKKFGGPLTLSEFYGEDALCTRFVEVHAAPFVSFAMYAEVMQDTANQLNHNQNQNQTTATTQQKKSSTTLYEDGIQQPLVRTDPIAQQECTRRPSMLVEYLTKLALNNNVNDNDKDLQNAVKKAHALSATLKQKNRKTRDNKDTSDNVNAREKEDNDPQKSIHSNYLQKQQNENDQDQGIENDDDQKAKSKEKKTRKIRVSKLDAAADAETRVPKTVLKRAKKMEQQDAAQGNKTRSLLSYAQKSSS